MAIVESAEQLPGEAEDIKNTAEPDFEAMEFMSKAKAVMGTGINMKIVAKIPGYIKTAVEDIKEDLMQLKDAVMELKNALSKLKVDG